MGKALFSRAVEYQGYLVSSYNKSDQDERIIKWLHYRDNVQRGMLGGDTQNVLSNLLCGTEIITGDF